MRGGREILELRRGTAGASALAVYAGIGAATKLNALRGADRAVRTLIRPKQSKSLTRVAKGITSIASPHVHPVIAAALAVLVGRLRGRGAPSIFMASIAVTVLDKLSRVAVRQQRPRKAAKHRGLDRYAYPSGHTSAMTAIGVAAASEISEFAPAELEAAIWAFVVLASASVGWSRLYLDEHWIDDVVGGWAAGIFLGLGAVAVADRLFPGGIKSRAFSPSSRLELIHLFR